MPVKVIEITGLNVQYRGVEALSKVSLDVEAGDYVGIVGPNGSGKTSLVKAVLGLVPCEGKVSFQGMSFREFSALKHVGYLPQKMTVLDPDFPATALEVVVSGGYCCKRFPKRISRLDHKRALETMGSLGIVDIKDRSVGRLSGGQQQRVLLARALLHSPQLLILDEPTAALDPHSRGSFYSTVQRLNKDNGVTVLLVSHDFGTVGQYASKLLYLDRRVIFYGTFEEFCRSKDMGSYFGAGQHIICHRH